MIGRRKEEFEESQARHKRSNMRRLTSLGVGHRLIVIG